MKGEQISCRITVAALAVLCTTTIATVAFAGRGAGTGINGSAHDLNVTPYTSDTYIRTCAFCHTPHNAQTTTTTAATPLWNHADIASTTLDPYKWVAPANQGKAFSTINDPLVGPTRLCMSCHDGVTAADAHGAAGGTGSNGGQVISASYTDALGLTAKRSITDLQTTHPIGFSYEAAASGDSGRGPSELVPSHHGFLAKGVPTGSAATSWNTHNRNIAESTKKISDTLYQGIMTCASCHDVHNTGNVANGTATSEATYNYFLWAPEEGSAICLSCHIK